MDNLTAYNVIMTRMFTDGGGKLKKVSTSYIYRCATIEEARAQGQRTCDKFNEMSVLIDSDDRASVSGVLEYQF